MGDAVLAIGERPLHMRPLEEINGLLMQAAMEKAVVKFRVLPRALISGITDHTAQ